MNSVKLNKKIVETLESVTITLTPQQASNLDYIIGNAIGGTITYFGMDDEGGLHGLWKVLDELQCLPVPNIELVHRKETSHAVVNFIK